METAWLNNNNCLTTTGFNYRNLKISCSLSEITGVNIDQNAIREYISYVKKDESPVIIMGWEKFLPGLYFMRR
jgi:hypothetical protein